MAPLGNMPSYASKFGQFWVRLRYTGEGEPPSREYVGEILLFDSCWINAVDLYSFIVLLNRKDFELCFLNEAPLRRFLEIQASKSADPKWKDWTIESSVQMDITTLVVKFWTGRVPDHDIELYLRRYCEIIQPSIKPVDKFGIWYGVQKYKVCIKKYKRPPNPDLKIHFPRSIQWTHYLPGPVRESVLSTAAAPQPTFSPPAG